MLEAAESLYILFCNVPILFQSLCMGHPNAQRCYLVLHLVNANFISFYLSFCLTRTLILLLTLVYVYLLCLWGMTWCLGWPECEHLQSGRWAVIVGFQLCTVMIPAADLAHTLRIMSNKGLLVLISCWRVPPHCGFKSQQETLWLAIPHYMAEAKFKNW